MVMCFHMDVTYFKAKISYEYESKCSLIQKLILLNNNVHACGIKNYDK